MCDQLFLLSTVPAVSEALEHIRRTGEERDQEVGCTEVSATTVGTELFEVRWMMIFGGQIEKANW